MKKKDSLAFKFMVGGLIIVLLPIIILGYFSVNKSTEAITEISKNQAEGIANDLASMTRNAVEAEMIVAKILADKNLVIRTFDSKDKGNTSELDKVLKVLNDNLFLTIRAMGEKYEGIFLADSKGEVFLVCKVLENFMGCMTFRTGDILNKL